MIRRWISIDKCPHGTLSIALDTEGGGTKLLPAKCCGSWTRIKAWSVTAEQLREIANELECAAGEMDDDERA
jgi:hypothetical protein